MPGLESNWPPYDVMTGSYVTLQKNDVSSVNNYWRASSRRLWSRLMSTLLKDQQCQNVSDDPDDVEGPVVQTIHGALRGSHKVYDEGKIHLSSRI